MKIMSLLDKVGLGRMTTDEYQANLAGLNVFFGAVIGVALAGTEDLSSLEFGIVLAGVASAVVSILYISSSRNRVVYSIWALGVAVVLPELINSMSQGHVLVPDKLRPTLVVWTLMAIFVEFWARDKAPTTDN